MPEQVCFALASPYNEGYNKNISCVWGTFMKRNISLHFFYTLMGLISLTLNLVHPVTPKFFELIAYPDYMFGLAFALMSLGAFLLSPMWSQLAHKHGYARIMALGIAMYGVGQLLFSLSRILTLTAFARFFAGCFSASLNVTQLLFLSHHFGDQKKGERIALGTAISVSSGALGYFIGGFIGNHNVLLAFYLQIASCFLLSALIFFTMQEAPAARAAKQIKLAEINPFRSFIEVRKIMNKSIFMFYTLTVLLALAFVSFETTFNYFIRKIFQLQPIYNGIIKGSIGILGLLLNITLNKWIAVKYNPKSTLQVYTLLIVAALISLICVEGVPLFIAAALLYYTLEAMQKPIMQLIGTENPIVFGGYNSMIALGNVTGSFSAGYLFTLYPKLPFWFSLLFAGLAFGISVLYKKEGRRL